MGLGKILGVIGIGAIALILILMILGAVVAGSFGLQWVTAPLRGKLEAREQVKADGDYRIDKYNHFFDLCAAIQSKEAGIKEQQNILETSENQEDRQRIKRNIAALKSERKRLIRQYNADARKENTEGQYKDSSLPYHIPIEYKGGVNTQCR